jgi:GNAT superfamily N-acetyltransferase
MASVCFRVAGLDGEVCWQSTEPGVAYITWIAVSTPNRGDGTRLLQAFEEYARDSGFARVECINCVPRSEEDAVVLRRLNFFQKNGYDFCGVEHVDAYIEGPVVNFKRSKRL